MKAIQALATAVVVVLMTSCTSSPTTEPTQVLQAPTIAEAEPGGDSVGQHLESIEDLWRRQTAAWTSGFEAGIEFWVANNYPDMGCSFDDYMTSRFPDGAIDGLMIERVPDIATVELDEGWVIPGGRLEGVRAEGTVYEVSVDSRRIIPGEPVPDPTTLVLHVTILDDDPYFFLGCS